MKTEATQSMPGATRTLAGSIGRPPLRMLLMAVVSILLAGASAQADTVGRQFPLYVADGPNNVVLKVDSAGALTQFAQIPFPVSVAVAPNGDVFVSSASGSLFKVDSAGNITQVVPDILAPFAIAFDSSGNLYVQSLLDGIIRKVDSAGNESAYGTGFFEVIAFGPDGHLYGSSAFGSNTVFRLDDSGNPVPFTSGGFLLTAAGLAFDGAGNLYVSAIDGARIVKVDSAGNQSVFSSLGLLQHPFGLAFDSNGVLYSTNLDTGAIVKINPDGTQALFTNGFLQPFGLAFSRGAAYTFGGFLSPVKSAPEINSGNAGKTYPLKWTLRNSSGADITALSAVKSITYKSAPCANLTGNASDGLPAAATGGTTLRYDSAAQQYVYNWASPPKAGCYILTLTLDSAQAFSAYFNLK